jgi:hypothetical protein
MVKALYSCTISIMKNVSTLILLLFIAGCTKAPKLNSNSSTFEKGKAIAQLKNKKLFEVSGIAASINNPGYLWMENDSGNPAEVYLVNDSLKILLTCKLDGIANRDWEDIALGPGPDSLKTYIYVADIGDNFGRHDVKALYRFEEPKYHDSLSIITITAVNRLPFRYPDGAKDAEAIMIDPTSKNLYVITKREKPVTVYKLPTSLSSNDTTTAALVARFNDIFVVAGNISHDGKEMLVKDLENVFYWPIPEGKTVEEMFNTRPEILPYDTEPQGEAICFKLDGSGYYTISEKTVSDYSFLRFYKRR